MLGDLRPEPVLAVLANFITFLFTGFHLLCAAAGVVQFDRN